MVFITLCHEKGPLASLQHYLFVEAYFELLYFEYRLAIDRLTTDRTCDIRLAKPLAVR